MEILLAMVITAAIIGLIAECVIDEVHSQASWEKYKKENKLYEYEDNK